MPFLLLFSLKSNGPSGFWPRLGGYRQTMSTSQDTHADHYTPKKIWVRKACNVHEFSTLRALVVVRIKWVDFGNVQPVWQPTTCECLNLRVKKRCKQWTTSCSIMRGMRISCMPNKLSKYDVAYNFDFASCIFSPGFEIRLLIVRMALKTRQYFVFAFDLKVT